jgi:plastocyanin
MMKRGSLFTALVLVLVLSLSAVGLAACSSSSSPAPPSVPAGSSSSPSSSASGNTVTIDLVAKNIAFDKSTITVPAGADVTVNFDNEDAGIPHNFSVYTDSSAKTPIFVGEIISGPKTITYHFTAPPQPGTYFFRCDVHPTIMTGTFVVQ